ncbi:MAG: hypothetical protein L3J05_07395 [Robiginitomaculum sp.]|nr:hypothetical protein [Robiginitomaculum sp.]
MILRKTVLGLMSAALLSSAVHAQINTDQLSAASAYDAGVLQGGGLDSTLWQGVSAERATVLINNIDTDTTGPARGLIRAALLSGGVPPQAHDKLERETYIAARLSAVLRLGDLSVFDSLVGSMLGSNSTNRSYTKLIAERALLGGDTKSACAIADENTVARKSPYWAKLRAFCHVVRGEIPAAELTSDLLVRSGYQDKIFFDFLGKLMGTRPGIKIDSQKVKSMDTPLQSAMLREIFKTETLDLNTLPVTISAAIALDTGRSPDDRLEALFASSSILSAEQIRAVLGGLEGGPLVSGEELAAKGLATKKWDAAIWGGAYLALAKSNNLANSTDLSSSAALAGAIFAQADKQNQLTNFARALESDTVLISAEFQAKHNPEIFARIAALRGDTDTLGGLFQALEADDPLRARIALASDALGNGFMLGDLGTDIESRLALTAKKDRNAQARAVRDTSIAVALGANLSSEAEAALRKARLKGSTIRPSSLLALQASARLGSKAEVALRAAPMIKGKPLRADAFAAVLSAMVTADMRKQAGQLAALDILR